MGVHHLEVQVRRVAVAGVAEAADQVACAQARTRAHPGRDRAGLEVGVAHVAAAADVLDDAVASAWLRRSRNNLSASSRLTPRRSRDDGGTCACAN